MADMIVEFQVESGGIPVLNKIGGIPQSSQSLRLRGNYAQSGGAYRGHTVDDVLNRLGIQAHSVPV